MCLKTYAEEFKMCDKMINYVYDDIKPRYNDGIHMIAFDMDFSGKNRRR